MHEALLQRLTSVAEQKSFLECDGLTRVLSYILSAEGIDHRTMMGCLQVQDREVLDFHCWIEVDHQILDFRARMWLGVAQDIPHGLFDVSDYAVTYQGDEVDMSVSDSQFSLLISVGS